ncbi:SpoVG family protein [Schlesneria sp. DSM 10557]|uniref:SpoVG family protein n=2 Tax=unclassified Schlesneria TaxID=2762017 RepID=UPI00359F59F8
MEITEIRIKLMNDPNERLQAFCSLTFDGSFVVRDLKIIQGTKGSFVAMPSRKLTDHCPRCSAKNHLRAQFCNECGVRLHQDRAAKSEDGRAKLYADIAHPINSDCRETIQEQVLIAYVSELERSKQPGYVCIYDDYGEDSYAQLGEDESPLSELPRLQRNGESLHRRDLPDIRHSTPHMNRVENTSNPFAVAQRNGHDEEDKFGAGII